MHILGIPNVLSAVDCVSSATHPALCLAILGNILAIVFFFPLMLGERK